MLTLPAGTAGFSARNMGMMMVFSYLYSTLFSVGGLVVGWHYDLPVGAVVVVLSGSVFLLFSFISMLNKKRRTIKNDKS
jgi:zinc transport system permease protein